MDARNDKQHGKTFAGLKETGQDDLYHASLVLLCWYLLSIGCLHYNMVHSVHHHSIFTLPTSHAHDMTRFGQ